MLSGSKLTFFSDAPVEDIEAVSTKTRSLFNSKTGEIAFVVPIKSFQFDKKLMQEHFNENYMESHKYPDATFKGKILGYNPAKKGRQKAVARGELYIHGVKKAVEADGTVEFKGGKLHLFAKFPVRVADYNIEIPTLVFYNIAEVVEVTLNGNYKLYEKK